MNFFIEPLSCLIIVKLQPIFGIKRISQLCVILVDLPYFLVKHLLSLSEFCLDDIVCLPDCLLLLYKLVLFVPCINFLSYQ